MFGDHSGVNSTAHVKLRCQAHKAWLTGLGQIVEDLIGDRLVEGAFVAVGPHIELQGFKLNAKLIRDILDVDRGEVGLARLGA